MSANYLPNLNAYTDLKPFRFWCQKVLPLAYDDSLSYYELLNKVVDYLNKTMEDVTLSIEDVQKLHTAYEQLQTYVNDYFDNLDVQEEINNKLDSLVENGTIHDIFNDDVEAILSVASQAAEDAIEAIPSNVTAWLNTHVTPESDILIDSSLTIDGAAADAKVTGDEIRALKSDLNDVEDAIGIGESVIEPVFTNNTSYYNTSGSTILVDNGVIRVSVGAYKTDNWLIPVNEGDVFIVTATGRNTGAYAFIGTIYETYADVVARYGVDVTVTNVEVTIPNGVTYLVVNNFSLGNGSVKKVREANFVGKAEFVELENTVNELAEKVEILDKRPTLKYSTRTIAYSGMQECIDIYIPAKIGYVNYIFGRTQNEAPQAEGGGNVWRLVQIDAVDDDFNYRYHITQLGETEMAIKIFGRSDFIGGTTHGDEWMISETLVFAINGKIIDDITSLTENTVFDTFKCYLVSNLYDPNDHITLVGVHGREWIFDASGLYIGQTVKFNADLTMSESYMPMICALRGNDTASTLQVTDTYIDDGNYQNYNVAVGGFTTYPNQRKTGIKRVNLFGKISGIDITVDYLDQPEGLRMGGNFLYNGVNTYNKLYNCLCGYGNSEANTQAVSNGDKWVAKSKISVNVSV